MSSHIVDPSLRSFIDVEESSHFPIQNLPYGVFRPSGGGPPRVGVAIGDFVVDLAVLEEENLFDHADLRASKPFSRASLNTFMGLGRDAWRSARITLIELLKSGSTTIADNESLRTRAILPMDSVEMILPVEVGDYTDFYSSREHATNGGR